MSKNKKEKRKNKFIFRDHDEGVGFLEKPGIILEAPRMSEAKRIHLYIQKAQKRFYGLLKVKDNPKTKQPNN